MADARSSSDKRVASVDEIVVYARKRAELIEETPDGAVNISTIKPQNETTIDVFLRAGSYDQVDTKATLNVPIDLGLDLLDDKLFGRFTFASFYNDGYTYNSVRDERASDRN